MPPNNGNPIVPTMPTGDDSNAAADTAFVTNAISTAFNAFGTQFDIQFVIPGGGSVLTTGNKGWLHVPCTAVINAWRIGADQTGTCTVDIWRAFDAVPTSSIVGGGTKPNLAGSQFFQAVPSGWTSTALIPDDWIAFDLTGTITNVTQITVCLTCLRSF